MLFHLRLQASHLNLGYVRWVAEDTPKMTPQMLQRLKPAALHNVHVLRDTCHLRIVFGMGDCIWTQVHGPHMCSLHAGCTAR